MCEFPVGNYRLVQRCEACDYDMCCVCAAPIKHAEEPTKVSTGMPTDLPTDTPTELLTDTPTELTDVHTSGVDSKTSASVLASLAELADADLKPMLTHTAELPTDMTTARRPYSPMSEPARRPTSKPF